MINCPKCGADNQIGAIFCRGCSEKLELDELTPENVRKAATEALSDKSNVRIVYLIKNIIVLIILLCLVSVLMLLYLAPVTPAMSEPNKQAMTEIEQKYDRFAQDRRRRVLTLTHEEVHHMLLYVLGLTAEELEKDLQAGQSGLRLTGFWAEVKQPDDDSGNNLVRLVLKAEHTSIGFLRFYRTIEGKVYAKEGGGISFEVQKAYMGRFPMHRFGDAAINNVVGHFKTALAGKEQANLIIDKNTVRVRVSDQDVKFYRQ